MLIREQVARTNVCLFCIDIGRYLIIKASTNQPKFDSLADYRTSSLFTDTERAALDYVTGLTRHRRVEPRIFSQLARFYSERQIWHTELTHRGIANGAHLGKVHAGDCLAANQKSAVCIGDRERIAAISITGQEIPL